MVLQRVKMTNFLSVCVFFVALLLFSFKKETKGIRIAVGVASGMVVILIVFCIVNCWDSSIRNSEKDELKDIISEEDVHAA
jgi:L-lactate permease